MNIAALRFAVEHATDIKGTEYTVLVALAYAAHRETAEAWPRIVTLAKKAHCSRKHARYCLDRLIERGYVRVGAPKKPGYPPTLQLQTAAARVVTTSPPMDTAYPPMGNLRTLRGTEVTSGVTSAGTNHAQLNREVIKEEVKLTRVSPFQKKQDDGRPNARIIPKRKGA